MIEEIRIELFSQKVHQYNAKTEKIKGGYVDTQIEHLAQGICISEAWYNEKHHKQKEKIIFHTWDKIKNITITYEK